MADQRGLVLEKRSRCQVDGTGEVHYRTLDRPALTECSLGGFFRPLTDTHLEATCPECIRVVHGAPAA